MNKYSYSQNPVIRYLAKNPAEFTVSDIIDFVLNNQIEMVTFMYAAEDGRLKSLDFIFNDAEYLRTILTYGERVDGSSLFRHIPAASSDLYVIPRMRTAFVHPFSPVRTLCVLCTFFDKNGERLRLTPEYTLEKACTEFTEVTGLRFMAMGELEYYVIGKAQEAFPASDQRGYHESAPFAKFNDFRAKCMKAIASCGADIKYGHCEVGNFTKDGLIYEQNEIEFLPVEALRAAEQLLLAKWVIRNMAYAAELDVTFAPKISEGKAGSGLHIHMKFVREDGSNAMLDSTGALSVDSHKAIAGLMLLAPAITAMGNAVPTSYCRLVPHQEAPTSVCWSECNRSVLVRVPLGWNADTNMSVEVNPADPAGIKPIAPGERQTIEIRSADASADVYLLLAALAVACRTGWEISEAEDIAGATHVTGDIHSNGVAEHLVSLPVSCADSADMLKARSNFFTARQVFSEALIGSIIGKLKSYPTTDNADMADLVKRHLHCG